MIAFFQEYGSSSEFPTRRIGTSLGLFAPDSVVSERTESSLFCQTVPPRSLALRRGWRAARSPSGRIALFDGWFDNIDQIAGQLSCPASDPATVYAHAVDRWGDGADLRLIGHYCSVSQAADGTIRLARSPLRAPPLHYAELPSGFVAASVSRVLQAAGASGQLSQRKLADSLFLNLTDDYGWYEGCWRVGLGQIVELRPGGSKQRRLRYYDPIAQSALPTASDADYLQEAERLLSEAARCAIRGARRPGVFLSGGLDSSNVAARVLHELPGGQTLPSFTFTPGKDWDGFEAPGMFGNERSRVESFARFHPRIEPHFVANEGRDFDYGCERMFLAIGAAPPAVANMWMHHGIYEAAREAGCDVLLSADLGNQTFSNGGDWAPAEYFRTLRWRQAWLALKRDPYNSVPIWRRFLAQCLAAQLNDPLWRMWRKLKVGNIANANEMIAMLRPEAAQAFDVAERARSAGVLFERSVFGSRRQSLVDAFSRGDYESSDIELGFTQIYGPRCRDVTAYRPLVEFCAGLPTRMFLRDGEQRWLARELGKGQMPEEQRLEWRFGFHNADWHARTTPRLGALRAELASASKDPVLSELIDFSAVEAAIEDWPKSSRFDDETLYRHIMGVPRAVLMSRFVRFASGSNQP